MCSAWLRFDQEIARVRKARSISSRSAMKCNEAWACASAIVPASPGLRGCAARSARRRCDGGDRLVHDLRAGASRPVGLRRAARSPRPAGRGRRRRARGHRPGRRGRRSRSGGGPVRGLIEARPKLPFIISSSAVFVRSRRGISFSRASRIGRRALISGRSPRAAPGRAFTASIHSRSRGWAGS